MRQCCLNWYIITCHSLSTHPSMKWDFDWGFLERTKWTHGRNDKSALWLKLVMKRHRVLASRGASLKRFSRCFLFCNDFSNASSIVQHKMRCISKSSNNVRLTHDPPPKFSETLRNLWNVRLELSRLGSEVPNLLMVAQKAERKLGKHSQVPRWKIGHVSELTLVRHHSGELPTFEYMRNPEFQ